MPRWQVRIQQIIFVLLFANTCLLMLSLVPPLFGYRSPFAAEQVPLLDMELPVEQNTTLLFGNMRFSAEGSLSLNQARLLINGASAGHFGVGELTARVYEGDIVAIDGSAYKRQLRFNIEAVSSNIDSSDLPPTLSTDGSITELPPIQFK